jgi:hypothetical protein
MAKERRMNATFIVKIEKCDGVTVYGIVAAKS